MIVDLRIYTCIPNRMGEFVALYEAEAWPIQKKYLGNCMGWYTTVEGALNSVVHMWGYADQGDREKRRSAMAASPEWQAYLARAAQLGAIQHMENRILKPTAFYEAFKRS